MERGCFTSPTFFLLLAMSLASILLLATLSKAQSGHCYLPPGLLALLFIGHLHLLQSPIHQTLYHLATHHGPQFSLYLSSTLCIITSSPDLIHELFMTHDTAISSCPQIAIAHHFAYDATGFAFTRYSPYWCLIKYLCMSELLGPQTVDLLYPVCRIELLDLLHTVLDKSVCREPVDMSSEIIKMTNNEVMRMAASMTSSGAGGETKEAQELMKQVAELIRAFNIADYISFCKNLDLHGLGKRVREVHSKIQRVDGEDHNGEGGNKEEEGDAINKRNKLFDWLLDQSNILIWFILLNLTIHLDGINLA